MKHWKTHYTKASIIWIWLGSLGLIGAAGTGISSSFKASPRYWSKDAVQLRETTRKELKELELWDQIPREIISKLFDYQSKTGHSLARILRDPIWAKHFALSASEFKGTWYASNPFALLPTDLQYAIKNKETPFLNQHQVWEWFNSNHFPYSWRVPLKNALIETTAPNLWRAGQGLRPFAKNGQLLEPIVYETAAGEFLVKNGHIATDPRIIPTNTEVFVILSIKGEERILRVTAADIGSGIKGRHVDLPVQLHDHRQELKEPHFVFPSEIRNPQVTVLTPLS